MKIEIKIEKDTNSILKDSSTERSSDRAFNKVFPDLKNILKDIESIIFNNFNVTIWDGKLNKEYSTKDYIQMEDSTTGITKDTIFYLINKRIKEIEKRLEDMRDWDNYIEDPYP